MKIYCILFDTVPRHPKIKEVFEKKGLHFADHITCSSTVPTLVTMLSGKTPTEMFGMGGIGHSHTYSKLLSTEKAKEWDENIILHMLPEDWKIHIHSMPETRGDVHPKVEELKVGGFSRMTKLQMTDLETNSFRLLPDDICGRNNQMIYYNYNKNNDEDDFIENMQKLPNDTWPDAYERNHFIFLKYNHYHDASRGKFVEYQGKRVDLEHEEVVDMFVDMIDRINFEEENSLFYVFADHGEPSGIDKFMRPPDSWLAWVSVTDNITARPPGFANKKVTKNIIGADEFKNTVLNRVFNKNLPNDVLSELDRDRIYVREDGRGAIDPNYGTTVSAIKSLDEHRYIQFVHHSPKAQRGEHINEESRTIIYDKRTNDWTITETNDELVNHLKSGPWRWYFTNE